MIQIQQQNIIKNWVFGAEYKKNMDFINKFQLNKNNNLNPLKKIRQSNCKSEQNQETKEKKKGTRTKMTSGAWCCWIISWKNPAISHLQISLFTKQKGNITIFQQGGNKRGKKKIKILALNNKSFFFLSIQPHKKRVTIICLFFPLSWLQILVFASTIWIFVTQWNSATNFDNEDD